MHKKYAYYINFETFNTHDEAYDAVIKFHTQCTMVCTKKDYKKKSKVQRANI